MNQMVVRIGGSLIIICAILGTAYFTVNRSRPIARAAIMEWFQTPAAVRYVGKYDRTYFSWVSHQGKIQIRSYDHHTKKYSPVTIVDSLRSEFGRGAVDDHNAPSLQILPDGTILVYYAVHNADRALFVRRSTGPETITDWGSRQSLATTDFPVTANYPKPVRLPNNELVLFLRLGTFDNSYEAMIRSVDDGRTWSKPVTIIDFGRQKGIYTIVAARENTIQLAWSVRPSSISQRQSTADVYTIRSTDGAKMWQHMNGGPVPIPVTEETAEEVYRSTPEPAFIWDVALDDKLQPRMVFATKRDPKHEFKYAFFVDNSWQTETITTSRELYTGYHFYSGGVVLDPEKPERVYLSKNRGRLEIEAWSKDSATNTWIFNKAITKNSSGDNFRLQVVRNAHPDAQVVWCAGRYEGFIDGQWSGFSKVNIVSTLSVL